MNNRIFIHLKGLLKEEFGFNVSIFLTRFNEIVIETRSDNLYTICSYLKNSKDCMFEQLIDLCGVDFFNYSESNWDITVSDTGFSRGRNDFVINNDYLFQIRFLTVYHLLSLTNNVRVTIRNSIFSEDYNVPSVVSIWPSANWFEREAYDLFGIFFTNHPFLHRILTDYNFVGHPLRKDFPLIGYKELKYDATLKKCVYVDVTIVQETVNTKVIR